MSYDYNALVSKLAKHRSLMATEAKTKSDDDTSSKTQQLQHLQEALQVFEELSDHCPMTPLLWMQYSYDMSELMKSLSSSSGDDANEEAALQARLQTLELALNEFPGSAILHLHYCELLIKQSSIGADNLSQAEEALNRALKEVGAGSHRNEGELIAQMYRTYAFLMATHKKDHKAVLKSFLQRAQTPMQEANDMLNEEVQEFCQKHKIQVEASFQQQLEDSRRFEAKAYSKLIPLEDEVELAMHQERIVYSDFIELSAAMIEDNEFMTLTSTFTTSVLHATATDLNYWNGLGAAATATAIMKYATAARNFQFPTDNEEDKKELMRQQNHLVISVYERGIAECPTVESVWLAYIKHLTWLWNHGDPMNTPSPQSMKIVTVRAVRNCPFSLALVQQQLRLALLLAEKENSEHVMDPEELLGIVNKSLDSKFLPTPAQALDLYMTAIRVVQRRVLTIVATSTFGYTAYASKKPKKEATPAVLKYDDAELLPTKIANKKAAVTLPPLDDEAWQEVQDLCEEIRDMFEAANSRLNKDHASWTEGRALLRQEWAKMEQWVIKPLLAATNDATSSTNGKKDSNSPLLAHYEKVIRLNSPSHPDAYRALIQYVLHNGVTPSKSPGEVVGRLRQVRGLYQKAIHSVGKSKAKDPSELLQTTSSTIMPRDYETALTNLCHDYQEFERTFGSDQSLVDATRFMQKKLQKTAALNKKRKEKVDETEDTIMEDAASVGEDKQSAKRKTTNTEGDGDAKDAAPPTKKHKTEDGPDKEWPKKGEAAPAPAQQQPKSKKLPKVKVGHIFHRAHPFTVRVSNLTTETQEMDMVETFREEHKCGAIVHAKIMREKPFHAKGPKEAKIGISKGWGLLQFEEREAVEKALELNENAEIHGQKVKVERSHVPAVGIVPPGMHRPAPKQQKSKASGGLERGGGNAEKSGSAAAKKKEGGMLGVLAFRPRGVVQKKHSAGPKKAHPKMKLAVPSTKGDETKE